MAIAHRPRITVGVPVFNGADHVAETLAALQAQTFQDFEALISIDGGDEASAAACRPFLDDPRITLTERGTRLDWAGNLNWLLRHAGGELFCFLQHDDLIEPTYFEALNAALERSPAAVVAYSDVSWFEGHSGTVWQDSLTGTPNERFRRHLELFGWIPLRGLVRLEAVRRIGLLRLTEFRCCLEEIVWLAKLAAAGDNIRVPETLYRKRFHAGAIHGKFHAWPSEQRMNAWVVAFSGLAGAIPLAASSITERAALVDALIERMLVETPGRWAFFETSHLTPSQRRDLVVHWAHRIVVDGEVRLADLMGEAWVSRLNASLAALQLEPFGPQEARERLPVEDRGRQLISRASPGCVLDEQPCRRAGRATPSSWSGSMSLAAALLRTTLRRARGLARHLPDSVRTEIRSALWPPAVPGSPPALPTQHSPAIELPALDAAAVPVTILPDPAAFGAAYLDEFTRVLDTYLTASPAAVLEWGAGHTTWQLLARLDRIGCRLFVTIDDWPDYLGEILREVRPRPWFRAILEDRVGPKVDQFDPELTYSTRPLQLETQFDFIYIDGRRRMECALVAALLAHEDTIVVIHDYRRGRYQPIRALFDILEDGPQFRVMKARPEMVRLFDERRREIMADMRAASPGQIAAFVDHPDVGGQR